MEFLIFSSYLIFCLLLQWEPLARHGPVRSRRQARGELQAVNARCSSGLTTLPSSRRWKRAHPAATTARPMDKLRVCDQISMFTARRRGTWWRLFLHPTRELPPQRPPTGYWPTTWTPLPRTARSHQRCRLMQGANQARGDQGRVPPGEVRNKVVVNVDLWWW